MVSYFPKSLKKENEHTVVHLGLRGTPGFDISIDEISSNIEIKVFLEIRSDLFLSYDLNQIAKEQTVRGLLVKRYLERSKDLSDDFEIEKELNALMYALQALDGKQIKIQ